MKKLKEIKEIKEIKKIKQIVERKLKLAIKNNISIIKTLLNLLK